MIVQDVKFGRYLVWDGAIENGPGIDITRSIGDIGSKKIGIISEPEIQYFDLSENDQYICMASNGIWDNLYSTLASYYINKFKTMYSSNLSRCSDFLINKTVKKAL